MAAFDSPGWVRIIGGEWRRRRLAVPAGLAVRPSSDRVRETVFNWLAMRLPGARCLDLFAGSGALGLEALSRGAGAVTLVESDSQVVVGLRLNVAQLGATLATIVHANALTYLNTPPLMPYHVVFLDPPFASGLGLQVLTRLDSSWLVADGVTYLETPREPDIPPPDGWRIMREGTTRQTHYRLLERAPLMPAKKT